MRRPGARRHAPRWKTRCRGSTSASPTSRSPRCERFLTSVPANARVVALAKEWLGLDVPVAGPFPLTRVASKASFMAPLAEMSFFEPPELISIGPERVTAVALAVPGADSPSCRRGAP